MSSRLFQEIREKRGLAYSVYSFLSPYADTGVLGVYLGTTGDQLKEALEVVVEQMADLRERPVGEEVLKAAREQVKGGLVLGLESSDRRMGRQAKNELYFGRDVSVEEIMEAVEQETPASVQKAAQQAFEEEKITGVVLGRACMEEIPSSLRNLVV